MGLYKRIQKKLGENDFKKKLWDGIRYAFLFSDKPPMETLRERYIKKLTVFELVPLIISTVVMLFLAIVIISIVSKIC